MIDRAVILRDTCWVNKDVAVCREARTQLRMLDILLY